MHSEKHKDLEMAKIGHCCVERSRKQVLAFRLAQLSSVGQLPTKLFVVMPLIDPPPLEFHRL
jgi:hypothetical protein